MYYRTNLFFAFVHSAFNPLKSSAKILFIVIINNINIIIIIIIIIQRM